MSHLSRRGFLGMIGGVAAQAAVRTWPYRVFSFPSEIKRESFYGGPSTSDWIIRPDMILVSQKILEQLKKDYQDAYAFPVLSEEYL